MDLEFWKQRWVNGDTGWHNSETNPTLTEYWPVLGLGLGLGREEAVLVPLCGKTLDMQWLREQGHHVVGIELSAVAAKAFFDEQGIAYQEREEGALRILEGERIRIVVGDIFDVSPEDIGKVGAVYDRAATVALPSAIRPRYAEQVAHLAGPAAKGLLVSISYEQSEMDGPPFSVPADEVERLYGARYSLKCMRSRDVIDEKPVYQERGLSRLLFEVHLLGCGEV